MSKKSDKTEFRTIEDVKKSDMSDIDKEILIIALFLQQTSNKDFKKILTEYKRQMDGLRQELSFVYISNSSQDSNGELHMNYISKYKAQENISKSIKKINNQLSENEKNILGLSLFLAYKDSYYKSDNAIKKHLKSDKSINSEDFTGIDFDMLDSDEVDRIINKSFKGDTWKNRVDKNNRLLQLELQSVVQKGLESNKSIYIINQEIKEVFNKSAYRVKRLFDTEMFRVFNVALLSSYALNKIEKVRYNAILDNRTCSECSSLDGEVFYIDQAPSLPLHSLCRCFYSSV